MNIYNAYSLICGIKTDIEKPEEILSTLNARVGQNTIRLFNEFLGLHCRSAVITAHAYGGLTLTGGVLKRLYEDDLFDYQHFLQFFISAGVKSVTHDLNTTPIHLFTGQHLAMKGLRTYMDHQS